MAVPVIFFHLLLAFGIVCCAVATPFVEGVAAVLPAADTVWSATGTAKYNYIIWAQNFIVVDDGFVVVVFVVRVVCLSRYFEKTL